MNGIEKITARIEQDARQEADSLLKEAQTKADEITAGYQAKANALKSAESAKGEKAAADRAERLAGSADMEAKKMLLAAKQGCIDEAFAKAQQELISLPREEYVNLLAQIAVGAGTGEEELIFSPADAPQVGALVVKRANELKNGAHFTLSAETRDMEGGLTLKNGFVEVNCAFETQLRLLRETMAADVAQILFN
ncbi:MAG: hypothetical protein GXW99_04160 [Clostridiales bacterium]|nr:hypothetical protein [Clostridiales bacterium]